MDPVTPVGPGIQAIGGRPRTPTRGRNPGKGQDRHTMGKTRRPTIFILQCGLRRAMSFLDRPLSPKRIYRMSEAPWKMNDR